MFVYYKSCIINDAGLDPAQPCFRTEDRAERLDESDADFVDVIHTNGRLLQKIGFGLPDPAGKSTLGRWWRGGDEYHEGTR